MCRIEGEGFGVQSSAMKWCVAWVPGVSVRVLLRVL